MNLYPTPSVFVNPSFPARKGRCRFLFISCFPERNTVDYKAIFMKETVSFHGK
ncbi:hypothetical protein HMPREF9141_0149 [Prevotella multiformis DSM 16608]|uniref:Uncharacterized protein n=1 Tax=Prevotella multiformis DSM 16608 TaxID=888743 RepID=F0F3I3_9BACT|nr:hypothetical protein HMPREF9141_0149 [Prevotella multiformis DSM 16608]